MKTRTFTISLAFFLVMAASNFGRAQTPTTDTEASQTQPYTLSQGQENVANKISSDFGDFLGNVDSHQVVTDLRNGQWTTTTTDPVTNTTTTTTEPLLTGKMGWGNVKISLALAQESLSQQGIMQPTSDELYTALNGGELPLGESATTTTMNGILQMRSEGMGWGQIAQEYGVKLGTLMSRINSGHQSAATTGTTTTAATTTTGEGIVNASGQASGSGIVTGKGNGKGIAGQKSNGKGIVNASGKSTGGSFSSVSHGSEGIVTGSGRSVGATSGIVNAGGHGNAYGVSGGGPGNGGGNGRGHNK
jgi:hypothetical protein